MTLTDAEQNLTVPGDDERSYLLSQVNVLTYRLTAERDRADRLAAAHAEMRAALALERDIDNAVDPLAGMIEFQERRDAILSAAPDARGQAILDRLAQLEAGVRAVLGDWEQSTEQEIRDRLRALVGDGEG